MASFSVADLELENYLTSCKSNREDFFGRPIEHATLDYNCAHSPLFHRLRECSTGAAVDAAADAAADSAAAGANSKRRQGHNAALEQGEGKAKKRVIMKGDA